MRRYEIYLPLKYNNGEAIESKKIVSIRDELTDAFGAIYDKFFVSTLSGTMEIRRRRIIWRHSKDRSRNHERPNDKEVLQKFDHKNLNLDTKEFKNLNPTAENIVVTIYNLLRPHINSKLDLQIRLYETPRNFVEYPV